MESLSYGSRVPSSDDLPHARASANHSRTPTVPKKEMGYGKAFPQSWQASYAARLESAIEDHKEPGKESEAVESYGPLDPMDIEDDHKDAVNVAEPALFSHTPLPLPSVDTTAALPRTSSRSHQEAPLIDRRGQDGRPPRLAISLQHGKHADFRPWTGDGPEDVMNDTVVRSGFADKSANSGQSESNMARPIIWPNLKNKNVLPALSTLFVQVMDKRQALGRCTAPSTFKPPPRVTLTDTKRETWLRDLANADVPLRRLSRTIPHGIRNKVLLDQCLSKRVPLARALWLIKCVGANEIRAFRRKGISGTIAPQGEVKWVKEWTLCVEQFIESVIGSCGQATWRGQIQYSIRLAAAMFAEDLFDRSHFLGWVITSFSKSSTEHLPIWMLLLVVFWDSLVQLQSRGRHLSEALLKQLRHVRSSDLAVSLAPLVSRLDQLVHRIAIQKPACFLPIKHADKYVEELRALAHRTANQRVRSALSSVIMRDSSLCISSSRARERLKSAASKLYEYLETNISKPDLIDTVERCQAICQDSDAVVAAVTAWACSPFRPGAVGLYFGIRVVRHIVEHSDMPMEPSILACISPTSTTAVDREAFIRFIFELTSTGHFNFGTYLQWIISSGALQMSDGLHTSILQSIPGSNTGAQTVSLRQAILSRIGQMHSPSLDLPELQRRINVLIDGTSKPLPPVSANLHVRVETLGIPDQLALSHAASQQIEQMCISAKPKTAFLTPETFLVLRATLESLASFQALEKLLAWQIPLAQQDAFPHFATTVLRHAKVFSAMGVLQHLTAALHRQHAKLRSFGPCSRSGIMSLLDLCKDQAIFASTVPHLEQDLIASELQHAAAVCSPASDSVLTVQMGEINADEDIDRILTSGNMMEEQMLARLFSAIVERTVKWTVAGHVTLASPCQWFEQLRMFDSTTFDRHMNNLVTKLVVNAGTDQVRAILIALIASGCLKIENALMAFEKRLEALETANAPQLPRFAVGVLQTFFALPDLDSQEAISPEIYRSRVAQRMLCDQHRESILKLIWHGMSAATEATNIIYSPVMLAWMSSTMAQDRGLFTRILHLGDTKIGTKAPRLLSLLTRLSDGSPFTQTVAASSDDALEVPHLLAVADELRLPFVSALLEQKSLSVQQHGSAEQQASLRQAYEDSITNNDAQWPLLLENAGAETQRGLYEQSCARILEVVSSDSTDGQDLGRMAQTTTWLRLAALTSRHKDEKARVPTLDRISSILQSFVADGNTSKHSTGTNRAPGKVMTGIDDISILVQLVNICMSAISDASPAPQLHRLLASLCTAGTSNILAMQPRIRQQVQDCASLVASCLNSDSLAAVYRKLPETMKQDAFVKFALDHEDSETKWLSLASRVPFQTPALTSPTVAQGSTFQSFPRSQSSTSMPSPSPRSAPMQGGGTPTTPVPQTPAGRGAMALDIKYTPYQVRRWEMVQDPTPNMGENDGAIGLQLFAARRVL